MKLTSENVHNVFMDCLFKTDEPTEAQVKAEGILLRVGFNPDRLHDHKQDIRDMLQDLPEDFQTGKGGGMSFLNMCMDKNKDQWTGMHNTQDELVTLGLATKQLNFLIPRNMWSAFPGGMPYIAVL